MALFKISKGNSVDLAKQSLNEGYAWFTPDDGKFYIDAKINNVLTRVPLSADRADKDKNGRDITSYSTFYFWLDENNAGELQLSVGTDGDTSIEPSELINQIEQAYKDKRAITCVLRSAKNTNNMPCPLPMFISYWGTDDFILAFSGSGGFGVEQPQFMTVLCQSGQWAVIHGFMVPTTRTINGKSLEYDIQLVPSDIGSVPVDRKVNNKTLENDIITKFIVHAVYNGITITSIDYSYQTILEAYNNGDYVVCQVKNGDAIAELPVISSSTTGGIIQFGDIIYWYDTKEYVQMFLEVAKTGELRFDISTLFTGLPLSNYNAHSRLISNVMDPASPQDAATKNYVDTGINNLHTEVTQEIADSFHANDAMLFKGTVTKIKGLPDTHEIGWTYKVAEAGSYAGQWCEVGDTIYCIANGESANDADWTIVENNNENVVVRGAGQDNSGKAVGSEKLPVYVNKVGVVNPITSLEIGEVATSKLSKQGTQDYIELASAMKMSADINANSHKITNLATPTNSGDAVNKNYADTTFVAQTEKLVHYDKQTLTSDQQQQARTNISAIGGTTLIDTTKVKETLSLGLSGGRTLDIELNTTDAYTNISNSANDSLFFGKTTALPEGLLELDYANSKTLYHQEITDTDEIVNKGYVDSVMENAGGVAKRYTTIVDSAVTEVPFNHTFTDTTKILVYQNGVLLTPNVNYTVKSDGTGIDFVDYTTSAGDVFTFIGKDQDAETAVTIAQRYTVNVSEATSSISFGKTINNTEALAVYQNGLLLTIGTHYTIKTDGTGIDLNGYSAENGDIFTFVYGEETSPAATADEIVRGRTVATEGASTISIPISIASTTGLAVYENGLLLEEGEQYTATTSAITLNGYTATGGDVYTFVSNKVLAPLNVATDASSVSLNSTKFDSINSVQDALEYLKDNLNTGDFLPLSGGSVTGDVTVSGTIKGANIYLNTSSSSTSFNYFITDNGNGYGMKRVSKSKLLTAFTSTTTTTTSGSKALRNIMYKTEAPTASEGVSGDICIVYEL